MKKDLRAVLKVAILTISLACATAVLFVLAANQDVSAKQKVRTVNYETSAYFDEDFIEQFDEFECVQNDNDLNITATKTFSTSIFDEIDLVSDNEESNFTIKYEIEYLDEDETVLLHVYFVGEETEELTDTIPGLVSYNAKGDPDVLLNVDEEYIWLSELTRIATVDEVGWFKNLVKKVANVAKKVVQAVATTVKKAVDTVIDAAQAAANKIIEACADSIIKPLVELTVKVVYKLLGQERATQWGAALLMMYKDPDETKPKVFHADFNCWQQFFGYIDVYDTIFKAATPMDKREYVVSYKDNNETKRVKFWAWKGDYISLGSGCELGIYTPWTWGSDIWKVDKSFAVPMKCELYHNGKQIIDWNPEKYANKPIKLFNGLVSSKITAEQWWITAFNSDYQRKDHSSSSNYENELTAKFEINLTGKTYYDAFKATWASKCNINSVTGKREVRFDDNKHKVTIEF